MLLLPSVRLKSHCMFLRQFDGSLQFGSWQSCTSESAVLTSGGLASTSYPDALKGDQTCALFMFLICRCAVTPGTRLFLNRILTFTLKVTLLKVSEPVAVLKGHYSWENWMK